MRRRLAYVLALCFDACVCAEVDPPIVVTGLCAPTSTWSEIGLWLPTGPFGEPFTTGFRVADARPDCAAELTILFSSDQPLPAGEVRGELYLFSCGQWVPDGAFARSATITLSPTGPQVVPMRFTLGPIEPCLTAKAREAAMVFAQPFGETVLQATISAVTPIYDPLDVEVRWDHVDIATWDDAPTPTPDAGLAPEVEILEPKDQDTVASPIRFVIRAEDVARVRLEVTASSTATWDPKVATTQLVTLDPRCKGPVRARLFGLDAAGATIAGPHEIELRLAKRLTMLQTYYYMVYEREHLGGGSTALFDCSCDPLKKAGEYLPEVAGNFFRALCLEGSGRLVDDSTYVNVQTRRDCPAAQACPAVGSVPAVGKCWTIITERWGLGSRGNALVPFESLATDGAFIAFGEVAYIPSWDGRVIPSWRDPVDGVTIGGFTHDGCFWADDVGAAITGTHFDLFVGPEALFRQMALQNQPSAEIYVGHPKCKSATRR